MLKFSRAYLEITNCCNLQCAFCPGTARTPGLLSPSGFRLLAEKLRPYTDYLYLHVMGEPLSHPQFAEILSICADLGFRASVTTNGTLLKKQEDILLQSPAVYKISVSLHSFEANEGGDFETYIRACAAFGKAAGEKNILFNFRLWNLDGSEAPGFHEKNDEILTLLHKTFPEPWQKNTHGYRLAPTVFLQFDHRFSWPDYHAPDFGTCGTCRALRDQIAVLCDGMVVPCCLDSDGNIPLGNLFTQSLPEIVSSPLALSIAEGFRQRKRIHPLCRHCGFSNRF